MQAERAKSSAQAPRMMFVAISVRFATALRGQAWKILDAIAWMAPDDRGPRVRALFGRFRRIDDRAPITASGAASDHVPVVTHPAWLARMLGSLAPDL